MSGCHYRCCQDWRACSVTPDQASMQRINARNYTTIVTHIQATICHSHTTSHAIYNTLTVICIKGIDPELCTVGMIQRKNVTSPCSHINDSSFHQGFTDDTVTCIERPEDMSVGQVECPKLRACSQANIDHIT